MTPDEAVKLGEQLLAHLGVKGWRVIVLPFIPENPDCYLGYCDPNTRIVSLAEKPDEKVNGLTLDIICHEVAHVLTPWSSHDALWEAAMAHIRPVAEILMTSETEL